MWTCPTCGAHFEKDRESCDHCGQLANEAARLTADPNARPDDPFGIEQSLFPRESAVPPEPSVLTCPGCSRDLFLDDPESGPYCPYCGAVAGPAETSPGQRPRVPGPSDEAGGHPSTTPVSPPSAQPKRIQTNPLVHHWGRKALREGLILLIIAAIIIPVIGVITSAGLEFYWYNLLAILGLSATLAGGLYLLAVLPRIAAAQAARAVKRAERRSKDEDDRMRKRFRLGLVIGYTISAVCVTNIVMLHGFGGSAFFGLLIIAFVICPFAVAFFICMVLELWSSILEGMASFSGDPLSLTDVKRELDRTSTDSHPPAKTPRARTNITAQDDPSSPRSRLSTPAIRPEEDNP
jgi:hypothetical protein